MIDATEFDLTIVSSTPTESTSWWTVTAASTSTTASEATTAAAVIIICNDIGMKIEIKKKLIIIVK